MQVVTAQCAPIVCVTEFNGTNRESAQVWNWHTGERLSEFPTVFDGMSRHAMSPKGEFYVAANWKKGTKGGVACYNTRTGERIWHRQDLGQVQRIQFSPHFDMVWCEVEAKPALCLDAISGMSLRTIRSVDGVIESPFSELVLHTRRRMDYVLVGDTRKRIPRITPATMDAVFSSDALCLSECGGPVRCIDCESGKERWRYVPPAGFHVIKLSYQADQSFYGLLFGYEVPETALIRLSGDHGIRTEIGRYSLLRRYGGVRYGGGDFGEGVFVTPTGHLVSLEDGRVLRRFAFPGAVEPCPPSPDVEGLRRHGYDFENVKLWRERESKAGRPSGLDDFYRANRICVICRGLGKLAIGVRWCDQDGVEQSEVGPVAALIEEHGLDDPKNWFSDAYKWDYLYETCSSCRGHYLRSAGAPV